VDVNQEGTDGRREEGKGRVLGETQEDKPREIVVGRDQRGGKASRIDALAL